MRLALPVFALLVCGCPMPPPVQRPYPPPSADELLASLKARAAKLSALRAVTRADLVGEGKLTVDVLVQRPSKLRLEFEAPIGGSTVATVVSDGKDFALLDTRNNRFLTGPAKACNVARLIKIELEPEDIVEALLGGVPFAGTPAGVSWDPTHGGREVLELKTPDGGSERIELDAKDRRWDVLNAERKDPAGHTLWKLSHTDFEDHDGIRLPKWTHVSTPPTKAEVHLKFKSVEPNATIDGSPFQLAPPAGIPAQPSDC
jgi:outer membrane lipoprotein-sorting protein